MMKLNPTMKRQRRLSYRAAMALILRRKGNVSDDDAQRASNDYERSLFDFAFKDVRHYWKQLGIFLGFPRVELDCIDENCQKQGLGVDDMAWSMLHKYQQWKGQSKASVEYLKGVLNDVKQATKGEIATILPDDTRLQVIGRDEELQKAEKFFWGSEARNYAVAPMTERRILVISGVGGVGKTTLANCYVSRHARAYSDGVFLFNAESYASLLASVRRNLLLVHTDRRLREEPTLSTTLADNFVVFFNFLRRSPRCVVVYDSADETELIKDSLPRASVPCHVLITTGKKSFAREDRSTKVLTLEMLAEESAIAALLRWAGRVPESFDAMSSAEQDFARKLAVEPPVEGLPLALAHAGIFIEQHDISFRQYWEKLESERKELDAAALDMDKFLSYFRLSHVKESLQEAGILSPSDLARIDMNDVDVKKLDAKRLARAAEALESRKHVYLTWEMDLDDIEKRQPKSYSLLQFCSVLSSQDIPQFIVRDCSLSDEEGGHREVSFAVRVRPLKERFFLKPIDRNDVGVVYSIHHLIHASVLCRLWEDADRCREVLRTVEERLMERVLPLFNGRHFGDQLMIALLPHVYSVARRMLELGMNSRRHFDVIDVACLLSLNYLQLETAKELYTMRTDNLEKSRDGSNIPREQYLRCYFGLARISMFLGDLLSAERNIKLGLQGRSFDQMTDDEIVTYWEGIFLLAHSDLCQGHFDKAERLLLMIVGVQDRLPTTDLFYVLTSLGDMYNSLAEYKKTLEVLNLALSLCSGKRKVVADLHLASCYVSYGYTLDRVNKPKEAHVHFTKGLDMLDALLPENDIRLANALHKSGDCLRKLGLISEGCDRSKRALEIAKSVFPPGSMELHKYLTRHARNLSYADKTEESIVYLKETLSLLELCGAKETAIATCMIDYICDNYYYFLYVGLDLLGDSLSDIG
ncbi:uncharacterized protein [Oscarella lobularis]|uniref:uncharacterized protein isoform X1 n=1 Tax=Oscarella lobularis TaxID=121494 RepID=UPI0033139223